MERFEERLTTREKKSGVGNERGERERERERERVNERVRGEIERKGGGREKRKKKRRGGGGGGGGAGQELKTKRTRCLDSIKGSSLNLLGSAQEYLKL